MHPGVELEDSVFTGGESYRGYYKEMKTLCNDWVSGVTSSTCDDVPKLLSCYSTEVCDRNLRDSSGMVRVPQSRRDNGGRIGTSLQNIPSNNKFFHSSACICPNFRPGQIPWHQLLRRLHVPSCSLSLPHPTLSSHLIL